MTSMPRLPVSACASGLLFAATLAGNWGGMREFAERTVHDATAWKGRDYCGNGEHSDAFRELAEKFVSPGATIHYCQNSNDGSLQPAERSTHLAISWAQSPVPVRFGGKDGVGDASAIIASRYLRGDFPGFRRAAENDSAVLWLREGAATEIAAPSRAAAAPPPPWREAAGAATVCAWVAWFAWRMRAAGSTDAPTSGRHRGSNRRFLAACVAVFAAVATAAALTHTFIAPAGLGVYGGKAKLLYLTGGIPEGFFIDPAFSSYQPAYPPGLALLTLCAYGLAGGCGEWLTQLIPVFATASALWLTAGASVGSRWAALWMLAAFLGKQTLQMATFYYAEPFVALLALLGWRRLREDRNDPKGWLLLGATGLFKAEGLILLFAVWAAFSICAIAEKQPARERLERPASFSWISRIAMAAALPLAWHIGCRIAGATFYDYASVWTPDWTKFSAALTYLLKTAFLEPWRYGFAYPLAVAATVAHLLRRRTDAVKARPPAQWPVSAIAALLCLVAFAFVYSLSLSPDFGWHLWSSAARLLWAPSLLVLAGGHCFPCRAEARSRSNAASRDGVAPPAPHQAFAPQMRSQPVCPRRPRSPATRPTTGETEGWMSRKLDFVKSLAYDAQERCFREMDR